MSPHRVAATAERIRGADNPLPELMATEDQRAVARELARQAGLVPAMGRLRELVLEQPIPGFPVVRLSASCDVGTIRLMHPKETTTPRRGLFRRRSKSSPRP